MLSEKDVNDAFNAREMAFWALAEIEDKMTEMAAGLSDYKEGSRALLDGQERIKALQPETTELKRKFTMACWQVERVQALLRLNGA
jgi:hypothetical protein